MTKAEAQNSTLSNDQGFRTPGYAELNPYKYVCRHCGQDKLEWKFKDFNEETGKATWRLFDRAENIHSCRYMPPVHGANSAALQEAVADLDTPQKDPGLEIENDIYSREHAIDTILNAPTNAYSVSVSSKGAKKLPPPKPKPPKPVENEPMLDASDDPVLGRALKFED